MKIHELKQRYKLLGPGLVWAGAAIGVSHLIQSTRAGANYGFSLLWIVVVANFFKYAAFEFGPRYASVMKESLLDGYLRIGRWALVVFLIMTFGTMFSIHAAVTIVTAGLASQVFGIALTPFLWSLLITFVCVLLMITSKYAMLDKAIKGIIIVLTLTTLFSVGAVVSQGAWVDKNFANVEIWTVSGIAFMVAFIGWMPSPIDVSVWHSLWSLEKFKISKESSTLKEALFDFRIGYYGTAIFGLAFLSLGALVMYGHPEGFSPKGAVFAGQFIQLYTSSLGQWSWPIVATAALATMFSTTLTVTDAFPRVLTRATELMTSMKSDKEKKQLYWFWMAVVIAGSLSILAFFLKGMTILVDIATTLSFVTAPVLAYLNHRVITGEWMPKEGRPSPKLLFLSKLSICVLSIFTLYFIYWRFILN
jgi:Mn2+/Fe2+ NRAMP family transporter